jgi:NADH dehydrogenase
MRSEVLNVVTGAFGYIGRYITRYLLEKGQPVRTLTTHPAKPNPFGTSVEAFPYNFDRPAELEASLRGASALYNTYWIRFEHGGATFQQAVRNTQVLFECARRAGVERVVHISVTNASLDSGLPYYRGKAQQEQALIESGLSYAIVRPTLVFGDEDILVNNMAWLVRRFPVFPIFGKGDYLLQPVYVGDLAEIAIQAGRERRPLLVDAVGPEAFTFEEFAGLLIARVRPWVKTVHVPPALGIALGRAISFFVNDVILTRAELQGLMDNLLTSAQPPNGATGFSDWLEQKRGTVGLSYRSELSRHFRWRPAPDSRNSGRSL